MTQLNTAYLLSVFQAAVTADQQGSYAIAAADSAEVAALVKGKYIKTSKRLHNEGGNVGITLVEGATEADLRVDFEIPDFPAAPVAPAAPVLEETAAAPVAPQVEQQEAPTAEYTAPAADQETIAAPFGTTVPEAAEAPTHTQPEFEAMTQTIPAAPVAPQTEQVVQEAAVAQIDTSALGAAPVKEEDGVKIIGDADFEVATVAHTRKGDVEIDVGVPFIAKISAAERKKNKGSLEHHPFNDIAAFKIQNPTSIPSFHVAGRAVKDMSNSVRRANVRFEKEGSPVTFRAQPALETDPKGPGVRVFAFFVSEAPEQRRTTKKETAEETAEE